MTEHDGTTEYADEAPAGRLPYSGMAIASFVLGVVGLFAFASFGWLLGLFAVVFGHTGRREIKQGRKQGWGYDIGGLVLGYAVLLGGIGAIVADNAR